MSLRPRLLGPLLVCLACEAGAAPSIPPPTPTAPVAAPVQAVKPVAPARTGRFRQAAGVDYLEILHVAPGTPKDQLPAADAELPMLIALHGRGDDPDGFKDLVDGLPVTVR